MRTEFPRARGGSQDQAERWFQRLHAADCSPVERAAFERWRAESPENAADYERASYLYRRAADLGLDPKWRSVARAVRQGTARRAGKRRFVRRSTYAAAVLVVGLGLGWRFWDPVQVEQHYATVVGERRSLALADGSGVVLDTDSALAVRYSRKRRSLVLERGQAHFTVAAQADRPFVVAAGEGEVRAVGTVFQVRKGEKGVRVVLLEGVVTVSASGSAPEAGQRRETLAAGEQLAFGADGRRWTRGPADVEAANGWTHGELIFDRRPLAEMIEEMNRYTRVKLRLGDPSLRELPVSGAFYGNDQDSLVQALELGWSLRAERAASGEIVLHRRD